MQKTQPTHQTEKSLEKTDINNYFNDDKRIGQQRDDNDGEKINRKSSKPKKKKKKKSKWKKRIVLLRIDRENGLFIS